MITRILNFLTGTEAPPRPMPEADAQHLLGALMLRMANADATLRFEEIRVMDRLLAERFSLSAIAAAKLRAESGRLAEALPPTAELGPLLRAKMDADQRIGLRQALRDVALADGDIAPSEARMIEDVSAMLAD